MALKQLSLNKFLLKRDQYNAAPAMEDALQLPKATDGATALVNKKIIEVMAASTSSNSTGTGNRKRNTPASYTHLDTKTKAIIGRYANLHGTTKALKRYSTADLILKESTVRYWKNLYKSELKNSTDGEVMELHHKSRGRPLMLGALDQKVQEYIKALRNNGGIVNKTIVICAAIGIVEHHDINLLKENGGPIEISKSFAESLLRRMHYVKKKGTKAARKLPENFEDLKAEFYTGNLYYF